MKEAFVDPNRDESLIIELLDLKHDVADEASAVWFLHDLAREQDAEGGMVSFRVLIPVFDWLCFILCILSDYF